MRQSRHDLSITASALSRVRGPQRRTLCAGAAVLWLVVIACSSPDPTDRSAAALAPAPNPPCSNLAIAASATVQSTFPGYSVDRLHDGSRDTSLGGASSWVNADAYGPDGFLPSTAVLAFSSPQAITQVDLFTSLGYEIQDYDVQVPAGTSWTTIASVRGNHALQITSSFAAVTTSQLRILTRKGPDHQPQYTRINELEVIGCPATVSTRITGRVTSRTGLALAGITVEAGGVFVTTDANGNYVIANLPLGTYTVHVSGGGYTFGAPQFQLDHNTVALTSSAPDAVVDAIGYRLNPIVYVHGFNSGPGVFNWPQAFLAQAGYEPFFARLETSLLWTPPFEINVQHLQTAIDEAKYTTGQPKVILFAHSMGGLVARTYLETGRYNGDVSQYFSFGSPHLGLPLVVSLACLPNQPAICQMSPVGMALFNLTHFKRSGVDYHEIGGDAPMWTTRTLFCFRLFGRKRCIRIPWPDDRFRNAGGWLMGALIAGPDDALVRTCSAIGQPGAGIDRFVTEEVHDPSLGRRDYFFWEDAGGMVSQQAYDTCVKNLLVTRTTATCGTRSLVAWGCVLSGGFIAAAPSTSSALAAATAEAATVAQRAVPHAGQLLPGQTVSRTVVVEGGGTTFSVDLQAGTAALSLVDPAGQVIDPAYVASITGASPADLDAEITTEIPSEAVIYDASAGRAQYYVPNARRGIWSVVVTGNGDIPVTGSPFSANVSFDSSLVARFTPATSFLTPGTPATFSLQLPAVASAAATVSVILPDGTTAPLATTAIAGGFTASYVVPNQSGYARVRWSVVGQRSDGVAFERGGTEDVQITSTALTWNGVSGESTILRKLAPGRAQALVLQAQVSSSFAGTAELAADLVNTLGTVVAHTVQPATLAIGTNTVALRFSGDDIYASALDGPYTLTDVVLIDTRSSALLAANVHDAYTTAFYRASLFAPGLGVPSVTTAGPYTMFTGDTLQLTARGLDPEGDALSYAWDLDGDGTFEQSGQTTVFTAPLSATPVSRAISVRVTDPLGNIATAATTIDISPNREVNLALQATASASSTFSGYAASRVHDGNTSTALGGATSWSNDSVWVCDTASCRQFSLIPATLELDLGATRTVSHVTLYTTESYPIQDYDVELWDGTGWDVAERVIGNTQLVRTHNFAPRTASKVRITGYTGPAIQPGFVRVNELQVYGY